MVVLQPPSLFSPGFRMKGREAIPARGRGKALVVKKGETESEKKIGDRVSDDFGSIP